MHASPLVITFAAVQKIIALIFLSAFFCQAFDQGLYYLDYLVEKKEYMKRCENKARPQMHCNGKCQLMKKIKEQQAKEQGQPPQLKLAAKSEIAFSTSSFLLTPQQFTITSHNFLLRTIGTPIDRADSVFHPPIFLNAC